MNTSDLVFVGAGGAVSAVNKRTGQTLWQTTLRGSFVVLLVEDDQVFAHANGWLHALDARTGLVRWVNKLPGMGYNVASLATAQQSVFSTPSVVVNEIESTSSHSDS
jgi:outer membrane protein assembly factor BamB